MIWMYTPLHWNRNNSEIFVLYLILSYLLSAYSAHCLHQNGSCSCARKIASFFLLYLTALALCVCQRFLRHIHLCAGVLMGSLTLLISTADSESESDDSYAAVPRRHSAGSSNSNPPATNRYRWETEDTSHKLILLTGPLCVCVWGRRG